MTDDSLRHAGRGHLAGGHSGRYPWGSGKELQSGVDFLGYLDYMKDKGVGETEVAKQLGISTTQLRAKKTAAYQEYRKQREGLVRPYKDKGMSTQAIAKKTGLPYSSVKSIIDSMQKQKSAQLDIVKDSLADAIEKQGAIDIGKGVDALMGISETKLKNTALMMQNSGEYRIVWDKVNQVGTNKPTSVKMLIKNDKSIDSKEQWRRAHNIVVNGDLKPPQKYTTDNGLTIKDIPKRPVVVDTNRVAIRYAEEGGKAKDGVIELRRGVPDLSLGNSNYAQVRIAVSGGKYLKGMAVYSDDLPKGVDMMFNTNKKKGTSKEDVLKSVENDPDSPFKALTRPNEYIGKDGKPHQGALNIVREEGDWSTWHKALSSQVLSKQDPKIAKKQLDLAAENREAELNDILSLTNPTLKRRLLLPYADSADSAAVHLKAAALPRQNNKVILPLTSIKDNEIYAPAYRNGEQVVLIRHPHGGIFEIPQLTVNNRNLEGKKILGAQPKDAVGISAKVAEQLSGADFDGDTVLVIPNNKGYIKTKSPLNGLKDFDTNAYAIKDLKPNDKRLMSEKFKQKQMGVASNLITDMTIKGASDDEIARADRYSMVVIDAVKHKLDYRQAAIDNNIAQLKQKYQKDNGKNSGGASTLISRAKSEVRVPDRKERSFKNGGPINKTTGEKEYEPTEKTGVIYINKKGKPSVKTVRSTKMYEAKDAYDLSSGTKIESVYADYANRMKSLGNKARLEYTKTPRLEYSPTAHKEYAPQVARLKAALNEAKKNAPAERRAQYLANAEIKAKQTDNPDLDPDELKSIKNKALANARVVTGAHKSQIEISKDEWEAIQAGALSDSLLEDILANTDLDKIKALAMPHEDVVMGSAQTSRARLMAENGYSQADIADALGVSVSTVQRSLAGE